MAIAGSIVDRRAQKFAVVRGVPEQPCSAADARTIAAAVAAAVRVQIAQHQKLEALAIHLLHLHLHHREIMGEVGHRQQALEIETPVAVAALMQLVQLLTHRLAETEALERHHQLLGLP